jgi:putative tryptophan/tyrosine transport system substrate-binding protein
VIRREGNFALGLASTGCAFKSPAAKADDLRAPASMRGRAPWYNTKLMAVRGMRAASFSMNSDCYWAMDRRAFLVIASALAAIPIRVYGQSSGRIYRLGILHPGTWISNDPVLADFVTPLRDLGYTEGKNLVVDRRYADGQLDRLPSMAQDLVKNRVDLILSVGTLASQAAKAATTTIPIVMLVNGDPVALGLVASYARPSGNATAVVISPQGSLGAKKLELLKEAVPKASRIALLLPDDPGPSTEQQLQEIGQAASSMRIDLTVVRMRGTDYETAFSAIAAAKPAGLVVGAHPLFIRDRKTLIEFAAKYRLPAMFEWPLFVKAGGLMSYGANEVETYREVTAYIDRVLDGANPGDLPVWQPSKLYLVINLNTAKALGLKFPPSLLLRADETVH